MGCGNWEGTQSPEEEMKHKNVPEGGGRGPAAQLIDILPHAHVNVRRAQMALVADRSGVRTIRHIGPCRGW